MMRQNSNPTQFKTDTSVTLDADGELILPKGFNIAAAEYEQAGQNLIMMSSDGDVVIEDYFSSRPLPDLISGTGARIDGDTVARLAGYSNRFDYADGVSIGRIDNITGKAIITRGDGNRETVTEGDLLYAGDILQTQLGGALDIVFTDGTMSFMGADSRLFLDQLFFNPSGQISKFSLTLLFGSYTFDDSLAKRSNFEAADIRTPAGIITIQDSRARIEILDGVNLTVTVLEGAQGLTGQVTLTNASSAIVLNTVHQSAVSRGYHGLISEVFETRKLDRFAADAGSENGEKTAEFIKTIDGDIDSGDSVIGDLLNIRVPKLSILETDNQFPEKEISYLRSDTIAAVEDVVGSTNEASPGEILVTDSVNTISPFSYEKPPMEFGELASVAEPVVVPQGTTADDTQVVILSEPLAETIAEVPLEPARGVEFTASFDPIVAPEVLAPQVTEAVILPEPVVEIVTEVAREVPGQAAPLAESNTDVEAAAKIKNAQSGKDEPGSDEHYQQPGKDITIGGNGPDTIFGTTDDDIISGGNGPDEIYGGSGDDLLIGGKGRDIFVFSRGDGHDVVGDFEKGDALHLVGDLFSTDELIFNQKDHDTVITFGKQNDSKITLTNVDYEDLSGYSISKNNEECIVIEFDK